MLRMFVFIMVIALAMSLIAEPLSRAFYANPILNTLILSALFFGIFYIFRQVQVLGPEVDWVERYQRHELGPTLKRPPTLLAPMVTMLGDQPSERRLSTLSMRSLLDGIATRLSESREVARYLIGLLIFLGLLGTFWGLLQTISAVGDTIHNLRVDTNDPAEMFRSLQAGLSAPLAGMGTAFSSSLFGLSGSLILGFLELMANQAQNRFYNQLEDWLSRITRLSSGLSVGEGEQPIPAYVSALLEQTAESLDTLQRIMTRNTEGSSATNVSLLSLSDRLASLTDQMKSEQALMVKLAENQIEIKSVLQRLADSIPIEKSLSLDEASRNHLRNVDHCVRQLLEESGPAHQHLIEEIRSEIKLLARTIAALGRAPG